MLKFGNSTSTTMTANQVIPITALKNTNNKLSVSNNNIVVNIPGVININASFVIQATVADSDISIQLYNGTTPIANVLSTNTLTAVGDYATFNLTDVEYIIPNYTSAKTNLNFVVNGACTLVNALGTVIYEK